MTTTYATVCNVSPNDNKGQIFDWWSAATEGEKQKSNVINDRGKTEQHKPVQRKNQTDKTKARKQKQQFLKNKE